MNKDWAKGWIDNMGVSLSQLLDMYANDVLFEDVIFPHKIQGKTELRIFFLSMGGSDAGKHKFTFDGYLGDATGGVVEWTWQIDHESTFLGVPAAGKQTTVTGVSVMSFKDAKITSQRDYWDAAGALRQLGALQ